MSKRQHEQDDWSADSASLFRDVRRSLDAKALERAPIDRVLARIQAGSHEAGSAAVQTTGAARVWLGHAAKGAIAVVLLGAASYGVFRAINEPAVTTSREELAAQVVTTKTAASGSGAEQPVPRTSLAPSDFQPDTAALAYRKEPSRAAASPRRRSSSNVTSVANPRASARSKSSPGETVALVRGADTSSVLASPEDTEDTTQHDTVARPNSVTPVAPKPSTPTSETEAREVAAPAVRKADPPVRDEPNELTLVKRIHAELRDSSFSSVLSLCNEHERLWPHGMFELERKGARAIALCGMRSGDAGRQASQFLAAHPEAPVTMRVKSACAMQLPKP